MKSEGEAAAREGEALYRRDDQNTSLMGGQLGCYKRREK